MKLAVIGLGAMGRHMAANLMKSGFALVVNDVRKEAASSHLKDGATWGDTPKAVAGAWIRWRRLRRAIRNGGRRT